MHYMENIEKGIEEIKSKDRLKELEDSGNYLFHGSPNQIETFEPRQAYTDVDAVSVPDGEPAVFASTEIETPIFRSIFHESRFASLQGSFELGFSNGEEGHTYIHANQAAIDACQDKAGYVYVFKRDDFSQRSGTEWVAYEKVKPIAFFRSGFKDISISIQNTRV